MRHSNGIVTLAEVLPAGYTEKGSFAIPLHERSSGVTFPVVADGRLWVRDNDRLFCYDVRAGVDAKGSLKNKNRERRRSSNITTRGFLDGQLRAIA
jgi:hypothetical protein